MLRPPLQDDAKELQRLLPMFGELLGHQALEPGQVYAFRIDLVDQTGGTCGERGRLSSRAGAGGDGKSMLVGCSDGVRSAAHHPRPLLHEAREHDAAFDLAYRWRSAVVTWIKGRRTR